jgi:hypothetical protein
MRGEKRLKDKNLHLHKVSVYDIVLIGVLLITPILSLSSVWHKDQDKKEAIVCHNNKLLEVHDLSEDGVISISNKGMKMTINLDKGRVRVLESNCPKHVCVHTGWISNSGQAIVCVPNRIMIEVKGRQKSKYHATSY